MTVNVSQCCRFSLDKVFTSAIPFQTNLPSNLSHIFELFGPSLIGQLKDWTQNGRERERKTCSKGPQGGIEPGATASRTKNLCVGSPLYQMTYQGAPIDHILCMTSNH